MLKEIVAYARLTKPGVTFGNVLTALAGYLLVIGSNFSLIQFIAVYIGMTLVISAACALNNVYDIDIDSIMKRTKKRPSVTGELKRFDMMVFAYLLLLLGSIQLYVYTNLLTVIIGLAGFVTYVWLYGRWSKRTSVHGTAVGAVSGALPIVGGYTAATNSLDLGALVVFLIIFFWQFPEFYSIAIYRFKEYKAAKVPLMPIVHGVQSTVVQIFIYTILYVLSTLALTLIGLTGWVYFSVMFIAGLYWIWVAYKGFNANDKEAWARTMFKISMYHILLVCLMLSVGPWLP